MRKTGSTNGGQLQRDQVIKLRISKQFLDVIKENIDNKNIYAKDVTEFFMKAACNLLITHGRNLSQVKMDVINKVL